MPNRIIKESICTSDTIDGLSWFEEVFFYRLMVNVDDYGRFDARPAILKARLFPLKANVTEKNVEQALNRLATAGLVSTYTVEDKPILQLLTWEKHQQIRNSKSKYPGPEKADLKSIEINCNQLKSDEINCPRNPIQSNPNPNPNPTRGRASAAKPLDPLFDQFWAAYPKKVAKEPAKKAFLKHKPDQALLDKMLDALQRYKRTDQWTRDGGQFIPNPATWLNQKRWEDELPKPFIGKKTVFQAYDQEQSEQDSVSVDLLAEARAMFQEKQEAAP